MTLTRAHIPFATLGELADVAVVLEHERCLEWHYRYGEPLSTSILEGMRDRAADRIGGLVGRVLASVARATALAGNGEFVE